MPFAPEQLLMLACAMLLSGTIVLWVLIDHFNERVKARERTEQTRAREESRREIAAYVAEGSISADDAAKILAAGADSLGGIKSTIRDCIESSAEAVRHLSGHEARAHARARAAAAAARHG